MINFYARYPQPQIGIMSEWKEMCYVLFVFNEIGIFYEEIGGPNPIELFRHS